MLPFASPSSPDQIYRLLTAPFLCAGIVHLLVALAFQLSLLRDVELLLGSPRTALLYLSSGAFGCLVSAALVESAPESGPSGAIFGVLGLLVAEVVRARAVLLRPDRAILILTTIVAALLLCGLFPWVDNFAHLSGFAMGLSTSMALLPTLTIESGRISPRIQRVFWGLFSAVVFLSVLVAFLTTDGTLCRWCRFFSCVPLSKDFCAEQTFNFEQRRRLF